MNFVRSLNCREPTGRIRLLLNREGQSHLEFRNAGERPASDDVLHHWRRGKVAAPAPERNLIVVIRDKALRNIVTGNSTVQVEIIGILRRDAVRPRGSVNVN